MTIIISQNGKNAQKVEPASFTDEAHLQEYIKNNPNSLPLDEINEDIHLLILAREFPTLSGPIDALGIDREGNVYVIETKLNKNPDKRTVVAQVMDYGAALWRGYTNFTEFLDTLDDLSVQQDSKSILNKVRDAFADITDDEIDTLKESVRRNIGSGKFKFVVLMDKLTDRLKDLILFINQNSQFDIYGVELEYYKHDNLEILIPRLFGAEVRKDVGGNGARPRNPLIPEVQQMVDAYVNNGGKAVIKSAHDSIVKFVSPDWPTWPNGRVHYELVLEEKSDTIYVSIHLEKLDKEKIQPLANRLKSLCPNLEKGLSVKVEWVKWFNGCVEIKYPKKTEPAVIADTLKRFIELTTCVIKEELEKLAPKQTS